MKSAGGGPGPILFYDGQCGLCDAMVRWCLRHDRSEVLHYAPLQGSTYASLSLTDKPASLDTMVLLDGQGLHSRGNAVLAVLRHIGGLWGWLGLVGRLIPRPLRDGLYRFVAGRRSRWFGGVEACQLPSVSEKRRFLP